MFEIDPRMWLDIAAMLLTIVMFVIYESRKISFVKTGRLFLVMTVMTFVQSVFDMFSIMFLVAKPDSNPLLRHISFIPCLICYIGLAFCFFYYVVLMTKEENALRKWMAPIHFVGFFEVALIVTSPFSGLIYTMKADSYSLGPMYNSLYVVGTVLFVFDMGLLVKNRKNLNRLQKISIISGIFLISTASLIQMIDHSIYIIAFADALMLVIMYATLENPGDYIVKNTGCYNALSFYLVAANCMKKKKHEGATAILIGIDDKDRVKTLLTNEALETLNAYLHRKMRAMYSKRNLFFMSDCSYAAIVDEGASKKAADMITAYTGGTGGVRVDEMTLSLSPYACLIPLSKFESLSQLRHAVEIFERQREIEKVSKTITSISTEDLEKQNREAMVVQSVRNAIKNDTVRIFYQPILNGETGKFSCAEALARISDVSMGMLYPGEFIPLAEKNGLIIPLGERIFEHVCRFVKYNNMKALGLDYIEVNLSTVQCMQDNLPERLIEIMDRYMVEPKYINIEITETAYAYDKNMLLNNMMKLKNYGLSFSMDDFGTGFSNAESLFSLPLKFVKLDMSLIRGAMESEAAEIILTNFVRMLHELGLPCVAEGVETEDAFSALQDMGIEYYQGYLFSKPIPKNEFLSFMKENVKKEELAK